MVNTVATSVIDLVSWLQTSQLPLQQLEWFDVIRLLLIQNAGRSQFPRTVEGSHIFPTIWRWIQDSFLEGNSS